MSKEVDQKILLLGGSGMVGRNMLEHDSSRKHKILAPTHDELDLLRREELEAYIRRHNPDCIVHAAGLVGGIQDNIANPLDYFTVNQDIGANVLRAAQAAGVPRVVNLGSSCMYPKGSEMPLSEEMLLTGALEPTNEAYALAKILTWKLGEYVSKANCSTQVKTLVPCNLYGRHDDFSPQKSHLVPAIIEKLHAATVSGSTVVEIWGDGSARREFMYSADMADAIFFAVENFEFIPSVMNIGTGIDYSIKEYYELAAKIVGYCGSFSFNEEKPSGMKRKLVDVRKQIGVGWSPETSLEDGLKLTYLFYCGEH